MDPKISIIIPCFNAQKHISRAIESILGQTYKNIEIIIVDDGSTDGTKDIVREYAGPQVKYIYQENAGPAAARNRGIFRSRGEYVAFCDSDDLWDGQKLEKQMAVFSKYSDCAMVGTNGIFIGDTPMSSNQYIAPNRINDPKLAVIDFRDLLERGKFYPSTVVVKKEALLMAGILFDSLTYFFEDVQLWLRIAKRHKVAFVNEPLVKRRYLKSSLSHKYAKTNGYAHIKVYLSALLDFPEHSDLIKRKLLHARYTIARMELRDGRLAESKNQLIECIKMNKLFGKLYFDTGDSIFAKLRKISAPYALLAIASSSSIIKPRRLFDNNKAKRDAKEIW